MNRKIVICGAGASGISAATKLVEHGFANVTILEAESRVGGRVNTAPFASGVMEMGAQYCHGNRNNPVYNLAIEHGLLDRLTFANKRETFPVFDTNGTQLPLEKTAKLFRLANEILERGKPIAFDGSLGNYFMKEYWLALSDKKYDDIDETLRYRFRKLYQRFQNGNDGSDDWFLSSSVSYVNYEDEPTAGENMLWNRNSRGFETVLDLLQKKIPGQRQTEPIRINILLNKKVEKITYDLNCPNFPAIQIECSDGTVLSADHLICTVSLGVLKQCHLNLFEPILPQQKINAIESLSFGVVDKLILEFKKPFWPSTWTGCVIAWNTEQLKVMREKDESRWLEDVHVFHQIDHQPNVLIAWIQGASARLMETLPENTVANQCMKLLKMIFRDCDVPDSPKNFMRTQWFSNPHFRGSYSSISVETDAMNASNVILAEPLWNTVNQPVIQFAGEATNSRHIASVHGAIESGWREAQRLIESFNV